MLITKNQLRTIIKEELTRTVIIREARQYHKIHGRIDEGFMSDINKKFGLGEKAILAILAMSIAAGAAAPSEALANDDTFGAFLEAALEAQLPAVSPEVQRQSVEMGKKMGEKMAKELANGGATKETKVRYQLDIQGALGGFSNDDYKSSIIDVLKTNFDDVAEYSIRDKGDIVIGASGAASTDQAGYDLYYQISTGDLVSGGGKQISQDYVVHKLTGEMARLPK